MALVLDIYSSLSLIWRYSYCPVFQGATSHILNQQTGLPSPGVQIELDKQQGESWQHIATGKTDADGRIKSLYPQAENMEPGVYKVTFKTGDYFKSQNMNTFFPVIPVIFNVTKQNQKLHIPLLLSQYGYSTYRGS
ncbi:hydroxyisourate hydrolase [Klebsiella pneumoniae]|nr:hydroxyisourate hydrolase [Klebsiella pneumoniae]EJR0425465.1 hydroxyisourate hydrolase [Klebsiella pneumoniae]MCQ9668286.1 hydroxyisourate hydrolase [Klebsiella pneumoniae]UOP71617.1 hydroxyisourate hydrolase [Klebsiella pneumoniae]UOP76860.1 hydroxyisourate hydrolase [Klebsiella pneumoniae]